jgi:hypothetical protein
MSMHLGKLFAIAVITSGFMASGAAPAAARGSRHHRGFFPNIPHGGPPQSAPDRECRRTCEQSNQLCLVSVQTNASACANATCATGRQDVYDACGADHRSDACRTARSELHQCLQPCRDAARTATDTCRSNKQTCLGACGTTPKPQPDPDCIAGCRTALQACRLASGTTAQSCYAGCNAPIAAAQSACLTNPRGSECKAALQTAQACVRDCSRAQHDAERRCAQDSQSCTVQCVNPTATPTATPTEAPTPTATPGT